MPLLSQIKDSLRKHLEDIHLGNKQKFILNIILHSLNALPSLSENPLVLNQEPTYQNVSNTLGILVSNTLALQKLWSEEVKDLLNDILIGLKSGFLDFIEETHDEQSEATDSDTEDDLELVEWISETLNKLEIKFKVFKGCHDIYPGLAGTDSEKITSDADCIHLLEGFFTLHNSFIFMFLISKIATSSLAECLYTFDKFNLLTQENVDQLFLLIESQLLSLDNDIIHSQLENFNEELKDAALQKQSTFDVSGTYPDATPQSITLPVQALAEIEQKLTQLQEEVKFWNQHYNQAVLNSNSLQAELRRLRAEIKKYSKTYPELASITVDTPPIPKNRYRMDFINSINCPSSSSVNQGEASFKRPKDAIPGNRKRVKFAEPVTELPDAIGNHRFFPPALDNSQPPSQAVPMSVSQAAEAPLPTLQSQCP